MTLDTEVIRRSKEHCQRIGSSVSALVELLLLEELAKHEDVDDGKKTRISTAELNKRALMKVATMRRKINRAKA